MLLFKIKRSIDLEAKSVLAAVSNVQKAVLILEVGVNLSHGWRWLRYSLIYKEKNSFLRWQLNSFAYNPHELGHWYIVWNQKFSLVNFRNLRVKNTFDYDRYSVRILGSYFFGLAFSLFYLKIALITDIAEITNFILPKVFSSRNLNFIFWQN